MLGHFNDFRRNQIMGHVSSAIYKRYANQIVGDDVSAAILRVLDSNALIIDVVQMIFTKDPSAPTNVDPASLRHILKDYQTLQNSAILCGLICTASTGP
jgi:hypothetical protein